MGPGDAMRPIFHDHETGILDQLGGAISRSVDRQNPVCIAVNDQRRYVDALEVLAEILVPRWNTRKTRRGGSACGDVPASLHGLLADTLTQQEIRVVEI